MDEARLHAVPLFGALSKQDRRRIAQLADEIDIPAGRNLTKEGDFSYEFFAIEDGQAEVTRGGEHLADLGPGDFFGEMGLLGQDRRNATVVATAPMRLITLDQWDMRRLEKAVPSAADKIRQAAEARRAS